ncbi:phage DNA packaging protein J [Oceaniovalibus sp. ACAM 378]
MWLFVQADPGRPQPAVGHRGRRCGAAYPMRTLVRHF